MVMLSLAPSFAQFAGVILVDAFHGAAMRCGHVGNAAPPVAAAGRVGGRDRAITLTTRTNNAIADLTITAAARAVDFIIVAVVFVFVDLHVGGVGGLGFVGRFEIANAERRA
jgi:hypothetical protein